MNAEEARQIRKQAKLTKKEAKKARLLRDEKNKVYAKAYIPDIMTRIRAAAEDREEYLYYHESDLLKATPTRTKILRRAKLPDGITVKDIMRSIALILREDGYSARSRDLFEPYIHISWYELDMY